LKEARVARAIGIWAAMGAVIGGRWTRSRRVVDRHGRVARDSFY
jgi:hypothetical protein